MNFGVRVRKLRQAKGLTVRALASQVNVGVTYLSRVETVVMTYGDCSSAALIHRLAGALGADEDGLLVLAKKVPKTERMRVCQRPDAFLAFVACDDRTHGRCVGGDRPVSDGDDTHDELTRALFDRTLGREERVNSDPTEEIGGRTVDAQSRGSTICVAKVSGAFHWHLQGKNVSRFNRKWDSL